MNMKKPILEDYGITQEQIDENKRAKQFGHKIDRENREIDKKAKKYGWRTFWGISIVCFLFSVTYFSSIFMMLIIPISTVISLLVYFLYKSQKQDVPKFNYEIEKKYEKYLKDLKDYELQEKRQSSSKQVKKDVEILNKPIIKVEKQKQNYTYNKAQIFLTKEQEQLFNEMLDISLKYCLDLKISEWRDIVGVGIIQQEHLRYWLTKSKDENVFVKFADTKKVYPFNLEYKSQILDAVNQVNKAYEENPEKYQLQYYKNKIAQQEKLDNTSTNTILNDIFDVDDDYDLYQAPVKEKSEQSSIVFDNSLFSIENTTLSKCYSQSEIQEYNIPNGVEIIGINAFADNVYAKTINIPETVKTINDNAFKNCKNLTMLTLPSSIVSIGTNILAGCDNLETLFVKTKVVKKLLVDVPKNIEIVCLEF